MDPAVRGLESPQVTLIHIEVRKPLVSENGIVGAVSVEIFSATRN